MAQINKPTDYFNTVLYTGDGTSSRDITGVGFQPDFTWIKQRSGVFSHVLSNSVSGDNKFLSSNGNGAEGTDSTKFRTFVSDGFQVGSHASVNANLDTYVGWSWLGGGTASSNTDGSITSSVSVNSTSGFSVVTYTGTGSTASVGHGLGAKPDLIISKIRSTTGDWNVYHDSFALNERIKLNSTGAKNTNTSIFSSLPTSSVVNIGNGGDINTSGGNHLFYCFKSVKGFSKFGSYTGNGNADGPFLYTGFKPAFVIIKMSGAVGNWVMLDNKRSDVPNANVNDQVLYANAADAELSSTTRAIDTLSNGFKVRGSGGNINTSGGAYIYMAFAENPLVGTNNIPATAR